jgi:hypothetical protein
MIGMKGRHSLKNWISIMTTIKVQLTDQNSILQKKNLHSIKRRLIKVNAERLISIINSSIVKKPS